MIIAILFLLLGLILNIIYFLLNLLNFVIPSNVNSAIMYYFGFYHYFDGIFPMSDLMLALMMVLTIVGLKYFAVIIIALLNAIPGVSITWPHYGKSHHTSPQAQAILQHKHFNEVMKGRGINTLNK